MDEQRHTHRPLGRRVPHPDVAAGLSSDEVDRWRCECLLTGEFGSMLEQGVVDPVKVTRSAVQNAVSIAGLLLTTEALVTDIPEDKPAGPPMPGGGGMDF